MFLEEQVLIKIKVQVSLVCFEFEDREHLLLKGLALGSSYYMF